MISLYCKVLFSFQYVYHLLIFELNKTLTEVVTFTLAVNVTLILSSKDYNFSVTISATFVKRSILDVCLGSETLLMLHLKHSSSTNGFYRLDSGTCPRGAFRTVANLLIAFAFAVNHQFQNYLVTIYFYEFSH